MLFGLNLGWRLRVPSAWLAHLGRNRKEEIVGYCQVVIFHNLATLKLMVITWQQLSQINVETNTAIKSDAMFRDITSYGIGQ